MTTAWLAALDKDEVGKGVLTFIHELKDEVQGLQPALDLLQGVADKLNALRASGHETERSGEGVLFNVPKASGQRRHAGHVRFTGWR